MELFDEAEISLCNALGVDEECRKLEMSAQLGFYIGAIVSHRDRTVGAWFANDGRLKFRSWLSGRIVLDAADVKEAVAAMKRMARSDHAFA